MSAQVMLNVRMDKGLKAEGDSVLARAGMSATEAIRSLYHYLEINQEIPECCIDSSEQTTAETRRILMRSLVGIAPLQSGEDESTLKAERLSRIKF